MRIVVLALFPTLLGGCVVGTIASTAVDIATLPVKAVSAGVDAATTSQSEADQNRGRTLRKAEEETGRRDRDWQRQCRKAQARGEPCPPRPSSNIK